MGSSSGCVDLANVQGKKSHTEASEEHQQVHLGVMVHGLDVTARSLPLCYLGNKKTRHNGQGGIELSQTQQLV